MEKKTDLPFVITKKKAHTDSILSIDVNNENNDIVLTASADQSIRLWDLRINSSIKQFKDASIGEDSFSNAKISSDGNLIYAGAGERVLTFDLKTDKILVNKSLKKVYLAEDDINFVNVSQNGAYVASCDDSNTIIVYDAKTLQSVFENSKGHTNIPFTVDFLAPSAEATPYCVSSGFDSQIIVWDLQKKSIFKSYDLNPMFQKMSQGNPFTPPLVYNIQTRQSTILASLETGHILGLNYKDMKKPKYIIDGHLGKVIRSSFCRFNENNIISVSNDQTFALWNLSKKNDAGQPSFMRRVQIEEKPNWIETTQNGTILVADTSEQLLIYKIKE